MRIELDFEKSVEENASEYFEQAKKAKRKALGLEEAILETKAKMAKPEKPKTEEAKSKAKKTKRQWFEAFHWFFSSNSFLVVGGRNAKDNEELVKKHFDEKDFFLHADIPGGSVCIIKSEGNEIPEKTFEETAQFAAVFSRAWKSSLPFVDVYAVSKEQVSKNAPSGESLGTGSFMVYGKRKWFKKTKLAVAIGIDKKDAEKIISGPVEAVKKNSSCFVELVQGKSSASAIAKKIQNILKAKSKANAAIHIDEIVRMVPSEGIDTKQ